jgi:hypothetical protein
MILTNMKFIKSTEKNHLWAKLSRCLLNGKHFQLACECTSINWILSMPIQVTNKSIFKPQIYWCGKWCVCLAQNFKKQAGSKLYTSKCVKKHQESWWCSQPSRDWCYWAKMDHVWGRSPHVSEEHKNINFFLNWNWKSKDYHAPHGMCPTQISTQTHWYNTDASENGVVLKSRVWLLNVPV